MPTGIFGGGILRKDLPAAIVPVSLYPCLFFTDS
jgi:hypothetical protein